MNLLATRSTGNYFTDNLKSVFPVWEKYNKLAKLPQAHSKWQARDSETETFKYVLKLMQNDFDEMGRPVDRKQWAKELNEYMNENRIAIVKEERINPPFVLTTWDEEGKINDKKYYRNKWVAIAYLMTKMLDAQKEEDRAHEEWVKSL